MKQMIWGFICCLAMFMSQLGAVEVRVKDVSKIKGLMQMQLVGYGLVIGLPGTGDRYETIISDQSLKNLLKKFGVSISRNRLFTRNAAAVMVTAHLSPFAKKGDQVDVNVSAIADARALTGGTLLMTPLRGPDGTIYMSAQGAMAVGGFNVQYGDYKLVRNFPVVGKLTDGGTVLNDLPNDILKQENLFFVLKQGDFELAKQLSDGINALLEMKMAHAEDASTVRLQIPTEYKEQVVDLITMINGLKLQTDEKAKIVVNERTGTVVIGENVKIAPVALTHGNLTIKIKKQTKVSMPLPFTQAEAAEETEIQEQVEEEKKHLVVMQNGTSIQDVVNALNSIGATPRDVISILQALKASGALHASIEII